MPRAELDEAEEQSLASLLPALEGAGVLPLSPAICSPWGALLSSSYRVGRKDPLLRVKGNPGKHLQSSLQ